MPPRFAYWTILIDNSPTAFRARDAQELLPTLAQLKRTNENVVLKWFSGGTLWDSPEAAREARRKPIVVEKRGADWRPGGQHRDPRARFTQKKKPKRDRDDRPRQDRAPAPSARTSGPGGDKRPFKPFKPFTPGARKPWGGKPGGPPGGQRPWSGKPGGKPGGDRPRFSKPWQDRNRPQGGGAPRKPWGAKPGQRPWSGKPGGGRPPGTGGRPPGAGGRPPGANRWRGPRGPHKRRDDEE